MTRRLILILGLVMTLLITIAPVAGAHEPAVGSSAAALPTQIELPNGFQPEGITTGVATPRLYVGSLVDGAIWRGSPITGQGAIVIPGVSGRQAAGIHIDRLGRLWVAGAFTHTVRVFSIATGELLKTYTFPTSGFVNDLAITRQAVYVTDSNNQQLLVIPLPRSGRLPDPSAATLLPLTGDYVVQPGFNANGIVARNGWLIIVQSNTGQLFRVDPSTGATKLIDTGGYNVVNGDGLALRGDRLYVVRNANNLVAVLQLGSDLLSASLVGEITAAPGVLDFPTTATFSLGHLYVVNARFSTPPTATTPYWITRLPTSP